MIGCYIISAILFLFIIRCIIYVYDTYEGYKNEINVLRENVIQCQKVNDELHERCNAMSIIVTEKDKYIDELLADLRSKQWEIDNAKGYKSF